MTYLIDTNVLLRFFDLSDSRNPEIVAAIDKITSATSDVFVCAQVIIEYWASATRPVDVNGFGLDPAEAEVRLAEVETLFSCLSEPPDMARQWRELAGRCSVVGKQAHDARIAALMLAHGVTHLITLNPSDFARYDGITAVTPQEIVRPTG
jgi:predicted nucleic acid-binding protein